MEILLYIFFEFILYGLLYLTGAMVLKGLTLGRYKIVRNEDELRYEYLAIFLGIMIWAGLIYISIPYVPLFEHS